MSNVPLVLNSPEAAAFWFLHSISLGQANEDKCPSKCHSLAHVKEAPFITKNPITIVLTKHPRLRRHFSKCCHECCCLSLSSFIPVAGGLYSMIDLSFIFIYSFLHSFTGFLNRADFLLQVEEIWSCR